MCTQLYISEYENKSISYYISHLSVLDKLIDNLMSSQQNKSLSISLLFMFYAFVGVGMCILVFGVLYNKQFLIVYFLNFLFIYSWKRGKTNCSS